MTAIEKLSGELVPVATAQLTVGAGPAGRSHPRAGALLSPDDNASVPSRPDRPPRVELDTGHRVPPRTT